MQERLDKGETRQQHLFCFMVGFIAQVDIQHVTVVGDGGRDLRGESSPTRGGESWDGKIRISKLRGKREIERTG